jgi:3-methyladenine DNA glycosylase/8-oxoguanine DNA glycosylase
VNGIAPDVLNHLSDENLRKFGVSRQNLSYIKALAMASMKTSLQSLSIKTKKN